MAIAFQRADARTAELDVSAMITKWEAYSAGNENIRNTVICDESGNASGISVTSDPLFETGEPLDMRPGPWRAGRA